MQTDYEMGKALKTARILHIGLMAAILIYAAILFGILPSQNFELIFPPGDPTLTIIEWTLGIIAVIVIFLGYYLPRWTTKWYKQNIQGLLLVHMVRWGLFESVAIYGLLLGVLGAGEQITIPFMVASAGALILTFPNAEKWKKMIEPKAIYSKYE